jgi:hypothetical protein
MAGVWFKGLIGFTRILWPVYCAASPSPAPGGFELASEKAKSRSRAWPVVLPSFRLPFGLPRPRAGGGSKPTGGSAGKRGGVRGNTPQGSRLKGGAVC